MLKIPLALHFLSNHSPIHSHSTRPQRLAHSHPLERRRGMRVTSHRRPFSSSSESIHAQECTLESQIVLPTCDHMIS